MSSGQSAISVEAPRLPNRDDRRSQNRSRICNFQQLPQRPPMLVKSLWSSAAHLRPTHALREALKANPCCQLGVGPSSRNFGSKASSYSRLRLPTLQNHCRKYSVFTPLRTSFEKSAKPRFFSANAPTVPLPVLPPPSVGRWLLFSSALVFAVIVVGGVTRLTESGLSITEWRPITGILPPLSNAEWQEEFEKYKETPEFKM